MSGYAVTKTARSCPSSRFLSAH